MRNTNGYNRFWNISKLTQCLEAARAISAAQRQMRWRTERNGAISTAAIRRCAASTRITSFGSTENQVSCKISFFSQNSQFYSLFYSRSELGIADFYDCMQPSKTLTTRQIGISDRLFLSMRFFKMRELSRFTLTITTKYSKTWRRKKNSHRKNSSSFWEWRRTLSWVQAAEWQTPPQADQQGTVLREGSCRRPTALPGTTAIAICSLTEVGCRSGKPSDFPATIQDYICISSKLHLICVWYLKI